MANTYTDQFYTMDPAHPPVAGTLFTVTDSRFTDFGEDGKISSDGQDTFEGYVIRAVWEDDTITVNIPGQGVVTVTGVTFYMHGHAPVFTPTDGSALQDVTFISSTFVIVDTQLDLDDLALACFTPGTLIDTITGACPIEQIKMRDLVRTADDGFQPVRWIGRRRVKAIGRFAPVRIRRGALGNRRDLLVSPQHRVLVQGWVAQLYAGQDDVLVPALHLVDGVQVTRQLGGQVDYLHLGFDSHSLICSEGIWTESHYASAAGRAEHDALFGARTLKIARPMAQKHESQLMAASMLS